MTLIAAVLIIEALVVVAGALLLLRIRDGRSGLETQWDDPVPEQYLQGWATQQQTGASPLA